MDPRFKMVLDNIGKSLFIVFAVNLCLFLIAYFFMDKTGEWGWGFKHGSFSVNGEQIGLPFSSINTRVLLAILFLTFTMNDLRRIKRKNA